MKTRCANCNKKIDRRPCRIRERNYCDAKCQTEYEYSHGIKDKFKITRKANEAMRKKGMEKFLKNPTTKISKRGYKMIYIPGTGWKRLHTYIWEQKNGKVPEGMILHHKNFDKLDNRIENLMLMSKKEHFELHRAKRLQEKFKRFL